MKIYVFGVGKGKDIVRECLKEDIEIKKYIDNNDSLWGKEVDGIPVAGPDEIDGSVDYIIISVKYFYHIYYQLISLGIDKKKIIPFFSIAALKDRAFWKLFNSLRWAYRVIPYHCRKIKRNWKKELNPAWRAHFKAQQRFWGDRGDTVLRFAYDLGADSVVFDLGGYKGDFTQGIVDKYDCYTWVFEPVPEYAERICERFKDNNKVKVFNFGLAEKNSKETLYMQEDGSSVYRNRDSSKIIEITYRCISDFLKENNIKDINLMKVNIEGGEYSLMEHMIKTGEIRQVENLQIQFHNIKKMDARKRQKRIRTELEKTHELIWAYRPFVFDSWKRK